MSPTVQNIDSCGELSIHPHKQLKNCGVPQKTFFSFLTLFRAHQGAFRDFRAVGHILWLVYSWTVSSAPGRLNATRKTLVLKHWPIHGIYGIFTSTGPYSVMQSGASPGSPVGNTHDWILFLSSIAVVFLSGRRTGTDAGSEITVANPTHLKSIPTSPAVYAPGHRDRAIAHISERQNRSGQIVSLAAQP